MFRIAVPVLCLVLFLLSGKANAAPAAPIDVTLTQQDTGARFIARPKGDEYVNWMETPAGYTVVSQGGVWYYAQLLKGGTLAPTAYRADGPLPKSVAGLLPHLHPPVDPAVVERRTLRSLGDEGKSLTRTQYVLVILVDFNNQAFTYSDSSFQSLIFGASNSVKDYYLNNTGNSFVITPAPDSNGTVDDGIVHVSAGTNHPNYGSTFNSWRTVADDYMTLANPYVDFSAFDANANGTLSAGELSIVMILAGYENAYGGASALTPRAWGHQSSLTSPVTLDGKTIYPYTIFGESQATDLANKHQATIGIMCHELGHLMLGLPDLYDTDNSSEGVGNWSLMGAGNWNYTGLYSGDSPSYFDAWCRTKLDMVTPTTVSAATAGASFAQVETTPDIKRIWIDKYKGPYGEYVLAENRQQTGYDTALPGAGLLVWHVDDARSSNAVESHKWVDLEEADGLANLDAKANRGDAGDPYPGTSNNMIFDNTSTPDSKDYSGNATGLSISNISASAATMTADLLPGSGGSCDHVTYDDNGANTYWGYGNTTVWTAIQFTNSTGMNTLDGIDLNLTEASPTVEIRVYQSLTANTPTTLLYTETGLSGVAGWNRFLFSTRQSFPAGSDRVVVVKIIGTSYGYPAAAEATSSPSNRCYIDANGIGAFSALADDFAQVALLSYVTPLTLTAPNGGEAWQLGSTHSITWNHNGSIGSSIKFKLYKGGVFQRFVTGTVSNTGSYSWVIPSDLVPGSGYAVQIYTPDYLYSDTSDAAFSVTATPLYLTAPNGGETWQMGTTHAITWTHDVSTGANVKFKLYKGGTFVRFLGGLFPNNDSFSWLVPGDLVSGADYKIFLYTPDYLYSDTSNANFTIADPPLRLTSPNGGESWQKGTVHNLTWNYDVSTGASVKFKLYKGGTFLRYLSGTVANNGSYAWTVPADLSAANDYAVQIYTPDYAYIDVSDTSFGVTD